MRLHVTMASCNQIQSNLLYKTTWILRTSADKDRILQVPRCTLSMLMNLHIKTTCVLGPHFVGPYGGLDYTSFTVRSNR